MPEDRQTVIGPIGAGPRGPIKLESNWKSADRRTPVALIGIGYRRTTVGTKVALDRNWIRNWILK